MSEAEQQKQIVDWFKAKYPYHERSLRVSQLGNHRGNSRKAAAIRTSKAKGQGAIVGEADIVILVPRGTYGALVLEHKTEKGTASDDQLAYLDYHQSIGNCAALTVGVKSACAAIQVYMEQ